MNTQHTKRTAQRGGRRSHKPHGSGRPQHHRGRGSRPSFAPRSRNGRVLPTFDPTNFIRATAQQAAPSVQEATFAPVHTFADFGLDSRIQRAIVELGITNPSPIQDAIIPEILKGNDVIGLAETGTGKTAAFLLPVMQQTLLKQHQQTLILTPTRELALQVAEEVHKFSKFARMHHALCVGGMPIGPQRRALAHYNEFIIGTPGRVLDLLKQQAFEPSQVTTVVLDEADRMLDMGFIRDITAIISATPRERMTLLFSATMDARTEELAEQFLRNPARISVKKRDVTTNVKQDIVVFEPHTKFETLVEILQRDTTSRTIIFGSMKHSVKRLAEELNAYGIHAESLHGNKTHGQRQRALDRFKNGGVHVLVATDVAARGIHVNNVSHVINYDLPSTQEDYIHRIGRTGRAQERGIALTFVQRR